MRSFSRVMLFSLPLLYSQTKIRPFRFLMWRLPPGKCCNSRLICINCCSRSCSSCCKVSSIEFWYNNLFSIVWSPPWCFILSFLYLKCNHQSVLSCCRIREFPYRGQKGSDLDYLPFLHCTRIREFPFCKKILAYGKCITMSVLGSSHIVYFYVVSGIFLGCKECGTWYPMDLPLFTSHMTIINVNLGIHK